ncbi:phosphate butyryltransferase [Oceanobacillus limi]|uniref:Phosphate butyryltransferase n=1 Tax=Oceanobacillus limi TaxID=930131 RepID=A0A1H9ZL70_9BACI|nr:phosphate butyryltransferase [Oceanobacillus limi]SES82475.1 phosphate butyryltransferase [Oceanobacillus limi]
MKSIAALKKQVLQEEKQTVSLANAADKEVLLAVRTAIAEDLCRFILIGDENDIMQMSDQVGLNLDSPLLSIQHETVDPSLAAVKAIHDKRAQILMKGNVATKSLLSAVLNKEFGLRTGNILSHVALFEIPNQDRLIFLTDAAMNIEPSRKEKVEILSNAVRVAHGIGMELPRVAPIAPVEVVNEAMPSTVDAAILSKMQQRGQIKGCVVDGPLAFDNAVSPEAAQQKGITSDVAGRADVLLVPTIDVGNALYKSFIYFADAKVAAIISGAKAPIVLTSRADSAESKLYSLSLALVSSKTF